MAATQADEGDEAWGDVEAVTDDPEERRVIFSALDSFLQYARVCHFNITHLRRQSFYALPQAQWQMLAEPPFNYLDTLDRVDDAIESNADLARAIVRLGLESFGIPDGGVQQGHGGQPQHQQAEPVLPEEWAGSAKHADFDKARSTIRQFFRDWSAEGAPEREACYGPVLRALEAERAAAGAGAPPLKVLVPGAGLGRLVFELSYRGFEVEGNEISYHMLLASSYVLNGTVRAGQHTIYPWVHTFSNHRTRANHLRSCRVPDIHPGQTLAAAVASGGGSDGSSSAAAGSAAGPWRPGGSMSMCASDFLCAYGDDAHEGVYDAVASVFFLDTAPNLLRYLETVYHCLRPGGVLVNLGPLLWHFENNAPGNHGREGEGEDEDEDEQHGAASAHGAHGGDESSGIADPGSFELCDDEVMALVERIGFVVERRVTGIEAPYIRDDQSMLQTLYRASFWVARKPVDGVEVEAEAES